MALVEEMDLVLSPLVSSPDGNKHRVIGAEGPPRSRLQAVATNYSCQVTHLALSAHSGVSGSPTSCVPRRLRARRLLSPAGGPAVQEIRNTGRLSETRLFPLSVSSQKGSSGGETFTLVHP